MIHKTGELASFTNVMFAFVNDFDDDLGFFALQEDFRGFTQRNTNIGGVMIAIAVCSLCSGLILAICRHHRRTVKRNLTNSISIQNKQNKDLHSLGTRKGLVAFMDGIGNDLLRKNGKLKDDGLIICVSEHAQRDHVVTLDCQLMDKTDIHHIISKKYPKNRVVPRVFVFDACARLSQCNSKIPGTHHVVSVRSEDVQEKLGSSSFPIHYREGGYYDNGTKFYFWDPNRFNYIQPKYQDLREELLANAPNGMFNLLKVWNSLEKRVAELIANGTNLCRTSNGKYRNRRGEPIDEKHLMALLIHTDLVKVAKEYSGILRHGDLNEVSPIAHWGSLLMEMVQCYGTKIDLNQQYYSGVHKAYMFKEITMQFNLPMSTSTLVSLCL